MSSAIRSLRFLPASDSKDRQRYSDGEVFYDRQANTLRVYTGNVPGGFKLATEEWVRNNQSLQNVSSDITPSVADTYSLGTAEKPWKSLYVSTNTIYIGGTAIGVTDGQLTVGDGETPVNLATEDYVNSRGFITSTALTWNNISSKPAFSTVATSGSYADLTNKPGPLIAIGFAQGVIINQFSNDNTMTANSAEAVPVQSAVRGYIDRRLGIDHDGIVVAEENKIGPRFATESYVGTVISNLVNTAPTTLDTLNELAAALGNDPNFATTVASAIGEKAPINNPSFTGTVSGITASMVGLGNVTNESKATMFNNPTFTGTVSGIDLTSYALATTVAPITLSSGVDWGFAEVNPGEVFGFTMNTATYDVLRTVAIGSEITFLWSGTPIVRTVTSVTLDPNPAGYFYIGYSGDRPFITLTAFIVQGTSPVAYKSDVNAAVATKAPINNPTFTGTVTLQQTTEVLNTKTGATGTVTHDFSTGSIWYHSSISANFTANFTNVPTTNNRTIVCTLVLAQGATAYVPNAVQIAGVAQTIRWLGAAGVPSGNSGQTDIVSFTLIRTGSAWTVLGSLTTFG